LRLDIEDVNKALAEVSEALELRLPSREYREALAEQATINEALCAENCVARWLWKSGELVNGYAVPWELQSVNTCPENFLWSPEENRTSILTVAPGLYEITFGFFSGGKKPTIQVLVNGETILSAVNSSSYVIHHSSGKFKNSGGGLSGAVKQPHITMGGSTSPSTGLTLIDFVALPAKARIAISYSGEAGAEGFFGLRKL
jgi:hypothetical protein